MSNKASILAALNNNKKTRNGARLSTKKTYSLEFNGDLTWAPPPQALKLLEIMYEPEEESWNEQELHDLISEHTEISEKQTPWAIFKYYRKQLIDNGFLSVTE